MTTPGGCHARETGRFQPLKQKPAGKRRVFETFVDNQ
jgi:hypothetical protein